MARTFIITFLLGISLCAYSQTYSFVNPNGLYICNIFEFSGPPASCEANFESLFHYWKTPYITNAADFKLLSYQLTDMIKDSLDIARYALLQTQPDALWCGFYSTGETSIHSIPGKDNEYYRKIKKMAESLAAGTLTPNDPLSISRQLAAILNKNDILYSPRTFELRYRS